MALKLNPTILKAGRLIGYGSIHSNLNCITLAVIKSINYEESSVQTVDIDEYNMDNCRGPLWKYPRILVPIASNWLKEHIFDVRYTKNSKRGFEYEVRTPGKHSTQKLLIQIQNSSMYIASYPHIPLAACTSIVKNSESNNNVNDISMRYYCMHRSDGCETRFLGHINMDEVAFDDETEVLMQPKSFPCIHSKGRIHGIVRGMERQSFVTGKAPRIQFNEALLDNIGNISHSYGNYNGSLRSIEQMRRIKHVNDKSVFDTGIHCSKTTKRLIHPSIAEVMKMGDKWKHEDSVALGSAVDAVDNDELGWVHSMDSSVPSFALYHYSSFKIIRKLSKKRVLPLYLDDISNLCLPVNGRRLLHSIIWMRDPSGAAAIPLAEFISCNWKSKHFGLALVGYVSFAIVFAIVFAC
eukprot:377297_1